MNVGSGQLILEAETGGDLTHVVSEVVLERRDSPLMSWEQPRLEKTTDNV